MKAAIYARVSTLDQEPENQLQELRRSIQARGWEGTEFVDHGVSGARDRRPALDRLVKDARRGRIDVIVADGGRCHLWQPGSPIADGYLTRRLFGDMLRRIWALPAPAD